MLRLVAYQNSITKNKERENIIFSIHPLSFEFFFFIYNKKGDIYFQLLGRFKQIQGKKKH